MTRTNFERMLQLAEEVFDAANDANQMQVDENVIQRLIKLHPNSVGELSDADGPYLWLLLLPTTRHIMQKFLDGSLNEKEMLDQTESIPSFDSIYLCSVMLLEEFREKGLAKKITIESINAIKASHPIEALFVWPFSEAGEKLATKVAQEVNLPLLLRK